MEIIENSPVQAWRRGCEHLLRNHGEDRLLRLEFPANDHGEAALVAYDPRTRLGPNFDVARDVANTIFPAKTWAKSVDRVAFYDRYRETIRRRPPAGWGAYFSRMINFGAANINQLERVIDALSTWRTTPKTAFVMHLSSSETDNLRIMGAPCLQYVQFEVRPDAVNLIAVYRNHDYCNKVLGNLFGLRRLLFFVCNEAQKNPGIVSSISLHAYFDASQTQMRTLLT